MTARPKLSIRGYMIDQMRARTPTSAKLIQEIHRAAVDLLKASSHHYTDEDLKKTVLRVLVQNESHQDTSNGAGKADEDVSEAFLDVCERHINSGMDYSDLINADNHAEIIVNEIEDRCHAAVALSRSLGGCFGITEGGHCGIVTEKAAAGDEIFMIEGGPETFLVRYQLPANTYIWLGEIYIYSFEDQIEKAIKENDLVTITVV